MNCYRGNGLSLSLSINFEVQRTPDQIGPSRSRLADQHASEADVPQLASTHLCYRLATKSSGSSCAVSLCRAA
jgi:hypothetical protein